MKSVPLFLGVVSLAFMTLVVPLSIPNSGSHHNLKSPTLKANTGPLPLGFHSKVPVKNRIQPKDIKPLDAPSTDFDPTVPNAQIGYGLPKEVHLHRGDIAPSSMPINRKPVIWKPVKQPVNRLITDRSRIQNHGDLSFSKRGIVQQEVDSHMDDQSKQAKQAVEKYCLSGQLPSPPSGSKCYQVSDGHEIMPPSGLYGVSQYPSPSPAGKYCLSRQVMPPVSDFKCYKVASGYEITPSFGFVEDSSTPSDKAYSSGEEQEYLTFE